MSLIEGIEDAQIKAAEDLICKNLDKLEIATDAVQRGGALVRDKLLGEIKQLKFELLMVCKLAADKPMFFNPLNAGLAKRIRDRVLENPDKY